MTHPHETRRQHSSQAHSSLVRIPNRECPPPPSFLCHPELLRRTPPPSAPCHPELLRRTPPPSAPCHPELLRRIPLSSRRRRPSPSQSPSTFPAQSPSRPPASLAHPPQPRAPSALPSSHATKHAR